MQLWEKKKSYEGKEVKILKVKIFDPRVDIKSNFLNFDMKPIFK